MKTKMHQYGINVNTLEKFILKPKAKKMVWGSETTIVSLPEYRLRRFIIKLNKKISFSLDKKFEATFFIETGGVTINSIDLKKQELISLPPGSKIKIESRENTDLYIFEGPADKKLKDYGKKSKPFDYRDKYWGNIQTIRNGAYAAKRIYINKGKYASLEYHCQKLESYFVHSGKLLLRLRAGRAEDRFFDLEAGAATITPPGLMHQRGGLSDTILMEISTRDSDSDSFLVEDGQKTKMPRIDKLLSDKNTFKGKICFDIDGVICTQTEGNYKKARPVRKMIALINEFYDEGFEIFLFTARFMGRNKNDWKTAHEDGYVFTKNQLDTWGVKYHEIFFGKPNLDVMIDDRAVFYNPNLKSLRKEILKKFAR